MRKGPGRFARFEEHDVLFPLVDSPTGYTQHVFSALCKSVVGTVSFDENGAFQYIPKQRAMRGVFGSGAKDICILQNEMVGVAPSGPCGFEIWYCPLASSKPGEMKRKLMKSPTFTVVPDENITSSPEEVVDQLMDRIRRTCCWAGKSMQQAVGVVLTPEASTNRPVLQKTFLPILQDAAALKVKVFDGVGIQDVAAALDFKVVDVLIVFSENMETESKQDFLRLARSQNPNIQVCFIPSSTGVNSFKSDWCPATTAHAVCKGSVSSLERSSSSQEPSQRQSKLRSAATSILNSMKDGSKSEQQWKGEPGFVCEVLRDIVSSGKTLKDKCGTLQSQVTMKTRWAQSQPNLLIASDDDSDDSQPRPSSTRSWRSAQLRSPFTGWGQHDEGVMLNNGWTSAAVDDDRSDTVPAYRPFLSASRQLSA